MTKRATKEAPGPDEGFTLEDALRSVLITTTHERDAWLGVDLDDDAQIRATLSFQFGPNGRVSSRMGICKIAVKPALAFWFGSYGNRQPTLEGAELVAKIGEVLGTPEESAPTKRAMEAQARRELPVEVGPEVERDPVDEWIDKDPPPGDEKPFDAILEQLAFTFDFAGLDEEDATAIKTLTIEIRTCFKRGFEITAQIGDKLRDVKRRLERGKWEEYLDREFAMSRDTGDRLIGVCELAEKDPQFAANLFRLPKGVQYLLVSPSTPEDARQEILDRTEAGELIPPAAARGIADRHKPAEEVLDAEVVVTGRTREDLLVILKANAMQIEELVEMGFTPGVIDSAVQERLIDKTVKGKCNYVWQLGDVVNFVTEQGSVSRLQIERAGCQIGAIIDAERAGLIVKHNGSWEIPSTGRKAGAGPRDPHAGAGTGSPMINRAASGPPLGIGVGGNRAPESPLEDLRKGRMLVVTFSLGVPGMSGKCVAGVRVGSNPLTTATTSFEASKLRGFPDAVQDLIVKQLAAAVKVGSSAKSKKSVAKKPLGKTARQIAAQNKRQAKRNPASVLASKKKVAAKRKTPPLFTARQKAAYRKSQLAKKRARPAASKGPAKKGAKR